MTRPQQILDVACRLFSERGFNAVSIDDIGKAAGVSGPALYRHFAGRAAILQGAYDLTIERLNELIGDVPDAPDAALAAMIRGQVQLALRYPELACAFEIERALPDDVRQRFRRRQRDHARRWVAAIRALEPARESADITLAVYAAIGMIISAGRWPRDVRSRVDIETVVITKAYGILAMRPLVPAAI